jgi:hypothetical protein
MSDQSVLGEVASLKSEVFSAELEVNDENLPPNYDMMSEKQDGYEFSITESWFDFLIKALMLRY